MATGSITVTLNVSSGRAGGNYTWQPGPGGETEFLYVSGGYNGAGSTATASIDSIPQGAFITSVSVTGGGGAYFMGQILITSSNANKIRNYLNSLCGDYSTTKISAVLPEFKYPLRFYGSTYGIAKPNEAIGSAPRPYSFTKTSNNTLVINYDTAIVRPAPIIETAPTGDGSKFRIEPQGVAIGGQVVQGEEDAPSFECYHDAYFETPLSISSSACLSYNNTWATVTPNTSASWNGSAFCCTEHDCIYIKGYLSGPAAASTTIATLPSGYRPAALRYVVLTTEDGFTRVLIKLSTGGAITIVNAYRPGTTAAVTTDIDLSFNFSIIK